MFLGNPIFHTNLKGYQVQNTTANVRDVAQLELVYIKGKRKKVELLSRKYLEVS